MSNTSLLLGSLDLQAPIQYEDGQFRIWNKNQIWLGEIGEGKFVAQVGDEIHDIVGAVIRDMYAPEVQKEEVLKRITDVIDKNLAMVQKIGFLLGEGASETEQMLHSIIETYKESNARKGISNHKEQ